jgi:MSHA biogenesis protein MshN
MSVINQMLKDLEQRSPESNARAVQPGHVESTYASKTIVLITSISVFAICFISFYVWHLVSENKTLKAEKDNSKLNQLVTNQVNQVRELEINENRTDIAPIAIEENQPTKKLNNEQTNLLAIVANKTNISAPIDLDKTLLANRSESNFQPIAAKTVINNSSSRVTPVKKMAVVADTHSHSESVSSHSHDIVTLAKTKNNTHKMSVSRRQLSADELAAQKLALAEKALVAKQIDKAEKLLEEVVIIKPNDSQTRKKLAALWFGRQAYQDAINLLSQGIALNGKNSSLRQMKARIHLKRGQITAALNTMKPLAQLKDEQYQIMLANIAQQAQQNNLAIGAYQILITMQPDAGRWYLGLAVLHDKSSQFILASVAYKQALTKNDLSVASVNFIQQRIQVIG